MRQFNRKFGRRRGIENQPHSFLWLRFVEEELSVFLPDADAAVAEFIGDETVWQAWLLVPVKEREDAAARAAGSDALEPRRRCFTERSGEIGDDEEMVFLGNASGLLVVFGNGGVLIA